jgi:hypothetical protein
MNKTLLSIAISAAALFAQPGQITEDKRIHIIADPAGAIASAGAFTFVSAADSFETAIVKGAPFSGEFITENVQTLADGNRIKNSNTTTYARDGEGRTRREITIDAIGPFTAGQTRKTIFIHDPVAKINYVLDPQEKTVRKINLGAAGAHAMPAIEHTASIIIKRRADGPKDELIADTGAGVTMERMPLPPGIEMHGAAGAVVRKRSISGAVTVPDNVKTDPLGKRIIEGIEAEGTRTTFSIPAGQIGNDRPLDTVSERWFSNELKTVVLTTRKDPRTGESTYKLTNLRRGEPSRHLFEPPSDYSIVTEDNVGPSVIRMRVEKKQE